MGLLFGESERDAYADLLQAVRRYLAARDATGQASRGTRADAERTQRDYYEALADLKARVERQGRC